MTTISVAINLYISKVSVLLKNSIDVFKGNILYEKINPNISNSYLPSSNEREVYFVIKNEKNPSQLVTAVDWVRFNL